MVEFTHWDKLFFPKDKITKGDVIDYYRRMAKVMLPYLKDRPENLLRHPNGITQLGFFQKNFQRPPAWVRTEKIYSESNRKYLHYLVCDNEATLLYMANLGCIEINPWNSRVQHLEKPDWLVIDLDPEGVPFTKVVEAAIGVRTVLEEINVPSFPKTSGQTGLHIYIPLGAKYSFDQAKQFTELVVNTVHQRLPGFTSLERNPAKRPHRVYLDYLQNRQGQTLAAPYSLRPVPGATVSTPLAWKEVRAGLNPKDFTITTIHRRLDRWGDIFKPVLGAGINLTAALQRLDQHIRQLPAIKSSRGKKK